jgi:hypothetical protein
MRKFIAGAILTGVLGIASYAALSATASDRPPDVDAKNWIAMGPGWGFVVESVSTGLRTVGQTAAVPDTEPGQPAAVPLSPTGLYASPDPNLVPRTLNGFFVVKRDGTWARIASMPLQ